MWFLKYVFQNKSSAGQIGLMALHINVEQECINCEGNETQAGISSYLFMVCIYFAERRHGR